MVFPWYDLDMKLRPADLARGRVVSTVSVFSTDRWNGGYILVRVWERILFLSFSFMYVGLRESDSLEQKLWTGVSCHVGSGN